MRSEAEAVKLAISHKGYLGTVCGQYLKMGIPFQELFSIGFIGLVEAAKRFDESKGLNFIAYADSYVRCEISKALKKQSVIRIPFNVQQTIKQVHRAIAELKTKTEREPDIQAIAEYTGLPHRKVINAIFLSEPIISLNTHTKGENEAELIEFIPSDTPPDTEGLFRAILKLSSRERYVIIQTVIYQKSYTEIGTKYGLSRTSIGNIRSKAINKLRELLQEESNGGKKGKEAGRTETENNGLRIANIRQGCISFGGIQKSKEL